jgi:hypothetical protein
MIARSTTLNHHSSEKKFCSGDRSQEFIVLSSSIFLFKLVLISQMSFEHQHDVMNHRVALLTKAKGLCEKSVELLCSNTHIGSTTMIRQGIAGAFRDVFIMADHWFR